MLIEHTRWVYDRGHRPVTRGWFHFGAAILSLISGTVLVTFSAMTLRWWETLGVVIYAVGVSVLFSVSAAYHLGRWRSGRAVRWWRRADHSTIAVFIAATYTPFCLLVLEPRQAAWLLSFAWIGAIASVVMNLTWIDHPRWLAVAIYLVLGWLIVPLIPQVWNLTGSAVVWLLFVGGVLYSVGAIFYALKWPLKNNAILGFHEVFHIATIVAAICHQIAVWIVVVQAG